MDVHFDTIRNIARIACAGPMDAEAILSVFDRVVSDARYRCGMARLWDLRQTDLSALDGAAIRAMGRHAAAHAEGIADVKVALVADRDLEFAYCRMFEMTCGDSARIGVFRQLAAAEAFLTQASDRMPMGSLDLCVPTGAGC